MELGELVVTLAELQRGVAAMAAAAQMAGTQVAGLQDTARTASKRVPLGTPLVASLLGDGSEGGVKKRQPAH